MPVREIVLTEASGEPPLPVYDTTGPYTDPDVTIDVEKGLPRTRIEWVKERGGVEQYVGRPIQPVDNGNVSGKHLARNFPNTPKPWRAVSSFSPPPCGRGVRGGGRNSQTQQPLPPSPTLPHKGEGARLRPMAAHPLTQYEWAQRRRHHQGNDLRRRARECRAQETA